MSVVRALPSRWLGLLVVMILVVSPLVPVRSAVAADQSLVFAALHVLQDNPPTVGVVVFYAPTPLPILPGVVLESFAAADLSRLLARSAPGRLTVIPAATMRRAEGDMHWQTADALHFDRLQTLAKAVGADRLVVGWIPLFSVNGAGGRSVPLPGDGGDQPQAEADIVAQVFDPSAGRLIAQTRQTGFSLGVTSWQVSTGAIHAALERSIPALLRMLGGQTS